MRSRGFYLAALLSFLAPIASRAGVPLDPALGRRLYTSYCSTCHGDAGDGNGPTARFLRQRPRDFTSGLFKFRTTPSGALPVREDLIRTVKRGIPDTAMPGWNGILTDPEIAAVVDYLRALSGRFEREESHDVLLLPERAPAPTADSLRNGRSAYLLLQCGKCHGLTGKGNGPSARTLHDDKGRRIDAADFTGGRLRSGGTSLDVYRTLSTGVNGTPMPSFAEALLLTRDLFDELPELGEDVTPEEAADVRRFIAGLPTSGELATMSEDQQRERVDALRWSLAHYVLSLSGRSWRLTQDPYLTK